MNDFSRHDLDTLFSRLAGPRFADGDVNLSGTQLAMTQQLLDMNCGNPSRDEVRSGIMTEGVGSGADIEPC